MENLNNLETSILLILEDHKGKDEAIKRKDLVRQVCNLVGFEVGDRSIRLTMKHLITQHGIGIGSRSKGGYFLAVTAQEIDEIANYFDSYGLSNFFVSSRLKKIGMKDYLGQLSLKYGG